jgi:hypothetical protein
MNSDIDSSGVRRALVLEAQERGFDSAEAVYRAVASLRDFLPGPAKKQLAVAFEWAREGINRQTSQNHRPAELEALYAAYGYARDVLLASIAKSTDL